jgi:hypothetical protein
MCLFMCLEGNAWAWAWAWAPLVVVVAAGGAAGAGAGADFAAVRWVGAPINCRYLVYLSAMMVGAATLLRVIFWAPPLFFDCCTHGLFVFICVLFC